MCGPYQRLLDPGASSGDAVGALPGLQEYMLDFALPDTLQTDEIDLDVPGEVGRQDPFTHGEVERGPQRGPQVLHRRRRLRLPFGVGGLGDLGEGRPEEAGIEVGQASEPRDGMSIRSTSRVYCSRVVGRRWIRVDS
jgi:hypothetical protein